MYEAYNPIAKAAQSNSMWQASEIKPRLLLMNPATNSTTIYPAFIKRNAAIFLDFLSLKMCRTGFTTIEYSDSEGSELPISR